MPRPFKRNDVVMPAAVDLYRIYGRVWKVLPDGHVVVICCGQHITAYRPEDLELVNYKGRWDTFSNVRQKFPVFLEMPSLRKLKRRAFWYHRDIWQSRRPKGTMPAGMHYHRSRDA